MTKFYRVKKTTEDIVRDFSEKHNIAMESFQYSRGGDYHYALLDAANKLAEITLATDEKNFEISINNGSDLCIKIEIYKNRSDIKEEHYVNLKKELVEKLSRSVRASINVNMISHGKYKKL